MDAFRIKSAVLALLLLVGVGCAKKQEPVKLKKFNVVRCVVLEKQQIEAMYTIKVRVVNNTSPSTATLLFTGVELRFPIEEDVWTQLVRGNSVYFFDVLYTDYSSKIYIATKEIIQREVRS